MAERLTCVGSDLCEELAGSHRTSFTLTYQGDPPTRMIGETAGLRLVADLSPLTSGHLLLLPLAHFVSFAHVVGELGTEIHAFLNHLIPQYTETFGPPIILEHGSSSDMNSACISHAHWHLLPVAGERVRRIMARDGLTSSTIGGFEDLAVMAQRDLSYFYCADADSHHLYGISRKMRSQYLRSVVGEVIGVPDPLWDYSLVVRRQLLRATVAMARDWNMSQLAQDVRG